MNRSNHCKKNAIKQPETLITTTVSLTLSSSPNVHSLSPWRFLLFMPTINYVKLTISVRKHSGHNCSKRLQVTTTTTTTPITTTTCNSATATITTTTTATTAAAATSTAQQQPQQELQQQTTITATTNTTTTVLHYCHFY